MNRSSDIGIMVIPTKKRKSKKTKINKECSFEDNGEKNKDTIDLISDDGKSNSNMICSCPVSQSPIKKNKCRGNRKKRKKTGGKESKAVYSKNHDMESLADKPALGVSNDHMVLSSSEDQIKNNEVKWEGYSPLHRILSGNKFGEVEKLMKMGYTRITGRWTTDEVEQLTRNMEEFLNYQKVIDYEGLILNRTKEDHAFRKKTQFVLKMCRGIFRTGHEINNKITDHFGKPFFKNGRFSLEEIKEFKRLHSLHGRNWKKIGSMLKRNANWMYHALHEHQSWKKGKWSLEEEKNLISSSIDLKDKLGRISWKSVSKRVQTRSQIQCRNHWLRFFSKINDRCSFEEWIKNIYSKVQDCPTDSDKEVLNLSDVEVKKLVRLISESSIDDEFFIDWNELKKNFDNVPSAAWLKLKFQAVCKEVPHSHKLEFSELVDQLLDIYERKGNEMDVQIVNEKKNDIQLIEITNDTLEVKNLSDDDDVNGELGYDDSNSGDGNDTDFDDGDDDVVQIID